MIDVQPPTLVDIHMPGRAGARRPKYDVYIGRHQWYPEIRDEFPEDSKWHNPFTKKQHGERALPMYEYYIMDLLFLEPPTGIIRGDEIKVVSAAMIESEKRWGAYAWNLSELTGKKLGCWCITTDSWENPVCHGQVLMKLWHESWERGELDES